MVEGPLHVRFPTTVWSSILQARAKSPEHVDRLCRRYWPPVCAFLIARGSSPADAEDVTQEVFLRLIKDDLLRKADADLGRFRSLLLGITKNVHRERARHDRARKRGGGAAPVSLDDGGPNDETALADRIAADDRDADFDRLWLKNLLSMAMDRMRTDAHPNADRECEALRLRAQEEASYEEIAGRLACRPSDVRNWVHRAKQRLRERLEEAIREYCSSREEFETEARYLTGMLGNP